MDNSVYNGLHPLRQAVYDEPHSNMRILERTVGQGQTHCHCSDKAYQFVRSQDRVVEDHPQNNMATINSITEKIQMPAN